MASGKGDWCKTFVWTDDLPDANHTNHFIRQTPSLSIKSLQMEGKPSHASMLSYQQR